MSIPVPVTQMCQGDRCRPVDAAKANDIAKRMQAQGLLQPRGVTPCTCGAIAGAHRPTAAQRRHWGTMDALMVEAHSSDGMARLMAWLENRTRCLSGRCVHPTTLTGGATP
jgi:hypothetical protein